MVSHQCRELSDSVPTRCHHGFAANPAQSTYNLYGLSRLEDGSATIGVAAGAAILSLLVKLSSEIGEGLICRRTRPWVLGVLNLLEGAKKEEEDMHAPSLADSYILHQSERSQHTRRCSAAMAALRTAGVLASPKRSTPLHHSTKPAGGRPGGRRAVQRAALPELLSGAAGGPAGGPGGAAEVLGALAAVAADYPDAFAFEPRLNPAIAVAAAAAATPPIVFWARILLSNQRRLEEEERKRREREVGWKLRAAGLCGGSGRQGDERAGPMAEKAGASAWACRGWAGRVCKQP